MRSFRDSNGDGTGDFHGLIEKLDYLQWLGVDCLWCCRSSLAAARRRLRHRRLHHDPSRVRHRRRLPRLRDGGPQRGIRIIVDFVDEPHQRPASVVPGRHAGPGRPYGDFYVWSDTDEKYADARIIFVDTEPSNWTWDPVRRQYFWHRFFSHQPDLNFDNPAVHEAMLDVVLVLARHGHRRVPARRRPLPLRARGHQRREPPRDPRVPAQGPRGSSTRTTPAGSCWPRPTSGPRTSSTTSATRTGRRVPHVLPLPGDAPHLHGRAPGVSASRSPRSWSRRRRSPTAANGASSCATTTS